MLLFIYEHILINFISYKLRKPLLHFASSIFQSAIKTVTLFLAHPMCKLGKSQNPIVGCAM